MAETSPQLKASPGNSGNNDSEVKKMPHLQAVPPPHCATDCRVHNTAIPQSTIEDNHAYSLVNIFSLHLFNQSGKDGSSNFTRQ